MHRTSFAFFPMTRRAEGARDMLRFAFLPSDFDPMILFLGEAPALRSFAQLLRSFARENSDIDLEQFEGLFTADQTRIRLTGSTDSIGMHRVAGTGRSFIWRLEAWHAEAFADMVEALAEPACKAGSVLLEAAHGEIKVKVSIGEYTDDYLTEKGGRLG
jgi:hypothetical protein